MFKKNLRAYISKSKKYLNKIFNMYVSLMNVYKQFFLFVKYLLFFSEIRKKHFNIYLQTNSSHI